MGDIFRGWRREFGVVTLNRKINVLILLVSSSAFADQSAVKHPVDLEKGRITFKWPNEEELARFARIRAEEFDPQKPLTWTLYPVEINYLWLDPYSSMIWRVAEAEALKQFDRNDQLKNGAKPKGKKEKALLQKFIKQMEEEREKAKNISAEAAKKTFLESWSEWVGNSRTRQ